MIIYLYDGTFEGLLTAIYEAYYTGPRPDQIMQQATFQPNLVDDTRFITTQQEKADRVYHSIGNKISRRALRNVYGVFLSEVPQAGTIIYRYLRLGWKLGPKVDLNLIHDDVLPVHQINLKVSRETHRMLGLVRFQLLERGLYYSPIEPDHNIVALIAPHFARRMADQPWLIHDLKRGLGALYNGREWILTDVSQEQLPEMAAEESHFQELWKTYFKHIAIPERRNPKLQRSLMPARYWKHLTEKQK